MPPDLSITVTATVDPPLGSDLAQQVGAEVAARLGAELISHADDDRGWHSWQWATHHDAPDGRLSSPADRLEEYLLQAIPARHSVLITSLEAVTRAEVERRLAAHGVPPRGQVRHPAGPPPEIPRMPDVVTTAQFAELLGVDDSRVRQLRAEAEKARAEGREHPFPAEYLPGYWLREDAERYAAEGRRRPGRPRKAERVAWRTADAPPAPDLTSEETQAQRSALAEALEKAISEESDPAVRATLTETLRSLTGEPEA